MRHVRIIDGVVLHPSIPVKPAACGVKKSALVHLHCEVCLSALDVSIRGTIGMLAGKFLGSEAGVHVHETIDA